jgi:hypothetical protein
MKNQNPVVVVLNLPTSISALIPHAQGVHDAMAANGTTFPSPPIPLVQFASDIGALVTAEAAVKNRTAGTVAARDEKQAVVVADLHTYKAYVQQIATANPTHAAAIAAAASMALRKTASRNKSDLAVKQKVSGQVVLTAKVAKGDRSHEWQYSLDGKTWTNAPPSLQGKTTLSNLQTGALTYFRHRAISKSGPSDWSEPVSALVG